MSLLFPFLFSTRVHVSRLVFALEYVFYDRNPLLFVAENTNHIYRTNKILKPLSTYKETALSTQHDFINI